MNANQILTKQFHGAQNFMTPRFIESGLATENRAWELSQGEGFTHNIIYGVTVVDYDPATRETTHRTDLGGCYATMQDAREAIATLKESA